VFSVIIKRFVKIKSGPSPAVALAAGGAVLAVSLFSVDLRVVLPASLLALFSMYMLYLLFNGLFSSKNTYALLMVGLAANLVLSAVSAVKNSMFYCAASTAMLFILTSFFLAIGFTNRVGRLSTHLKKLEDLNRQFIHTATRLRLKVEQLKRVVQEKELELFQMSKHASLAEITTGIAHELTQPLTGIKGIAQNMIDDINNDEFDKLQAVAELLKISFLVDKSSSIIDHIRNFSKKNGMNMQFIDLNKVILNAVDLINLQFKKYNIDIVLILDEQI
jgi:signal transduction histidine kinase